ncbi:hypothetical protein GDO81_003949 [Engystomops pustulosus]|uniref:Uncharacterized protein n=1 Tax=Engystomops pustulosus TaxID=76066 RepID=A0AAV7A0S5_ENGPU|nr:hypothetical protein GDO81_003949 [Engystomops pustulosus]
MAHYRHAPSGEPDKDPGVEDEDGCPDPSPSRALAPEDSDFLPSISLAAALLLIFISVLPILSQPGTVFVPFNKLGNISRRGAQFHPLLYVQHRSTQLILETLTKNQEETITIVAVAKESATRTLVCFSKNVIALLSKQGQGDPVIRQKIMEVQTLKDMMNDSKARTSEVFSISVMTRRQGDVPHCTILRPTRPMTGHIHLTEIMPQDGEVTMRTEAPSIAHDLLEHLYKTGQVPETFEVKGSPKHDGKILHVLGDPYLESGIVC